MPSSQTVVVGAFVRSVSSQLGVTLRSCYAIEADDPFADLTAALSCPALCADDDAPFPATVSRFTLKRGPQA